MEADILDSLEDLGYEGEMFEEVEFKNALEKGPSSPSFTGLVSWIAQKLCKLENIEATVSPTSSAEDAETFELELSGLLTELHCPVDCLTKGEIVNRFGNKRNRLLLLDFLVTELQAARLVAGDDDADNKMETDEDKHWDLSSKYLKQICQNLQLSRPPPNITAELLFTKLESQLRTAINKSKHGIGKPLLQSTLSEQQWAKLAKINEKMRSEYSLRRKMLLKRLDVTVQSFKWSDRAKGKEDKLAAVFQPKRKALKAESDVTLASLMAAREDLAKLKKTSSGLARRNTQCAINKVLIGSVPDRGGRPSEATPPPPEMPSFRKRTEGAPRGGRGGGGRGGGRVQGGWSNQGEQSRGSWSQNRGDSWSGGQGGGYQGGGGYQQNYQQGGGGYHQGGGGYHQGGGGYQQGGGSYQHGGGGYQQGGGSYHQGGGGYQQRGGHGGRGGHQRGGGRGKRGGRR